MLSEYEIMEQFAYINEIDILIDSLPENLSGYFYSNTEHGVKTITLDATLSTLTERTCILAEEIEHYLTTPVDLFSAPKTLQQRFERIAKFNATKRLIPFEKLIKANEAAISNMYELAEYLDVTIDFLEQGIRLYREHFSNVLQYHEYVIRFEPLSIKRVV